MLPSSSSNSSQSSFDSPISQYLPQQHAWFPTAVPRRREQLPKYPRFYSTPLNQDHPDSTPLHIYGLEEREPSIAERPRRFLRFSRALDDIKEDFTPPQPNRRSTAEAIRARRQSTFSSIFFDNNSNPTLGVSRTSTSASTPAFHSSASTASTTTGPMESYPPPPVPADSEPMRPLRRLSRRLSSLSFSQRRSRYRAGSASISQPNLIGSSNQL
ncbi:hypothetical protein BDW62DRAFT_118365 [Aspergillus aurantiobrunneus]